MVATTGAKLLPDSAVETLCKEVVPAAFMLTPNIPEAKLILSAMGQTPPEIRGLDDLRDLAVAVQMLGPQYVLLKGGHVPLTSDYKVAQTNEEKSVIANVLVSESVCEVIESPYRDSKNTHGTGCSLACEMIYWWQRAENVANGKAAAIACNLASGQQVLSAVRAACQYVDAGIEYGAGRRLGRGCGPIDHFHSLQISLFAP